MSGFLSSVGEVVYLGMAVKPFDLRDERDF